jgi:HD-GYP domain-containing protein (c-di-GMP phosphodiesterase class II)
MIDVKSQSLLRKFSIIFVGVALIPFIILFFLHSLYDESHRFIQILDAHFSLIIVIIGVISILGFFGMRMMVKKIILLTKTVKESVIDKKTILELAKEEGEIGDLAKSFFYALQHVDEGERQPKETKKIIYDVLKRTSEVLAVVNDHDNLIRLVLETSTVALGAKQGALFTALGTTTDALAAKQGALFAVEDNRYALKVWVGNKDVTSEQVMENAQSYLDQVASHNRPFLITAKEKSKQADKILTPPLVFSPLVYNEKFLGALCFCGNGYWNKFSNEHMVVVLNLSHQLAVSLENAKIKKHSDQTCFETLTALALAVEARDPYSRGHSGRVGKVAQKIGELMGLSAEDIKTLRDASMLHDIGKIATMHDIFIKQGKISEEEKFVIRSHPVISESIVLRLQTYKHILDPIRHHHEQLDGSGYPDGLKGGNISKVTSILTIADLFDTFTENRSYRSGMDVKDALKELDNLVIAGKIDKDIVHNLYHIYYS